MARRKPPFKTRSAPTGLVPVLRHAVKVLDGALDQLGRKSPAPKKRTRSKTSQP